MKKFLLFILAIIGFGSSVQSASALGLYDCYQSQGRGWPSVVERAADAATFGIWKYSGTREQNTALSANTCPVGEDGQPLVGFSVATGYQKNLRTSMNSTQTFVPVTSLVLKDNTTLTMSALGSRVFLTLEPGTAREEIVLCTDIVSSTINFDPCVRGLSFSGTSTASVSANKKTHAAGSKVVMSNVHYVYEELLDKDTNQTASGTITFGVRPLTVTSTPTDDRQVVNLYDLRNATTTGGVMGTTTINGTYEAATDAEAQAGTVYGSTGAVLVITPQSTNQTSTANKIPVADGAGKINPSYINTSTDYNWGGVQTFATTSIRTSTMSTTTITQLNLNGQNANTLVGGASSNADALHSHNYAQIIYTTTTDLAITGSTAETMVVSTTLAANTLSTSTVIHGHFGISAMTLQSGASNGNFTITVYYGSGSISQTVNYNSGGTIGGVGWLDFTIIGAGTTSTQDLWYTFNAFGSNTGAVSGIKSDAFGAASIDSTVAQNIKVTFTYGATNTSVTISNGYIEVIPKKQ